MRAHGSGGRIGSYSRRSGYVCPSCGKPVNPRRYSRTVDGQRAIVSTATLCDKCEKAKPAPRRRQSYKDEADAIQARLDEKRRRETPPG